MPLLQSSSPCLQISALSGGTVFGLNFLGVPNQDGFFEKDLDPKQQLTDGWQGRAYEHFKSEYPESLLLFYINHLGAELDAAQQVFLPAA